MGIAIDVAISSARLFTSERPDLVKMLVLTPNSVALPSCNLLPICARLAKASWKSSIISAAGYTTVSGWKHSPAIVPVSKVPWLTGRLNANCHSYQTLSHP